MGQALATGVKVVAKGTKRLVPVSLMRWEVIPGVIASLVFLGFLLWFGVSVSGTSKVEVCEGAGAESADASGNKKCTEKTVSNKWRALLYIIGVPLFGLIVGSMVYRLGFMIYNPKFSAGVEAGSMVAGIFRGK